MNWDYIAGFFDGEGNVHILKIKSNQLAVVVRMYNKEVEVLNKIKEFIRFGNIYIKEKTGVSELTIAKKSDIKIFLENIRHKLITKKKQVDYLLDNYKFDVGVNNFSFDVDTFRSFITRKNQEFHRKLHTNT